MRPVDSSAIAEIGYLERDRTLLVRESARHGVPLRLRGIRPALPDLVRWLTGRTDQVRLVGVPITAVLFQAVGRKG